MPRCPQCRGPVKPRESNACYPFCSPRCRAVDLGKWVTGAYRVPGPPATEEPPKPADDEQ